MKKIIEIFSNSFKEFKNVQSLVVGALLIALHTVFATVLSIQVTSSLRISISFIVNLVTGVLFGPVMGLVCAGIGDIVQFLIKPTGPYFFGWTFNSALAGLIYGSFLYGKYPNSNKDAEGKKYNILLNVFNYLFLLAAVICYFVLPLGKILDTADKNNSFTGTGFAYLTQGFNWYGLNVSIIAVLIIVMFILTFVLDIFKKDIISLIIAVLGSFSSILALYTDKKVFLPSLGIICIMILMILYILIKLVKILNDKVMDTKFFIRLALVLLFDTLLVNVFFGTVWVSVMYGKGFMFYFTSRFIKNLVQYPINVLLSYYVLKYIKKIPIKRKA